MNDIKIYIVVKHYTDQNIKDSVFFEEPLALDRVKYINKTETDKDYIYSDYTVLSI